MIERGVTSVFCIIIILFGLSVISRANKDEKLLLWWSMCVLAIVAMPSHYISFAVGFIGINGFASMILLKMASQIRSQVREDVQDQYSIRRTPKNEQNNSGNTNWIKKHIKNMSGNSLGTQSSRRNCITTLLSQLKLQQFEVIQYMLVIWAISYYVTSQLYFGSYLMSLSRTDLQDMDRLSQLRHLLLDELNGWNCMLSICPLFTLWNIVLLLMAVGLVRSIIVIERSGLNSLTVVMRLPYLYTLIIGPILLCYSLVLLWQLSIYATSNSLYQCRQVWLGENTIDIIMKIMYMMGPPMVIVIAMSYKHYSYSQSQPSYRLDIMGDIETSNQFYYYYYFDNQQHYNNQHQNNQHQNNQQQNNQQQQINWNQNRNDHLNNLNSSIPLKSSSIFAIQMKHINIYDNNNETSPLSNRINSSTNNQLSNKNTFCTNNPSLNHNPLPIHNHNQMRLSNSSHQRQQRSSDVANQLSGQQQLSNIEGKLNINNQK